MISVSVVDVILGFLLFIVSVSFGRVLLQYKNEYQPIASLFQAEKSVGFNAIWRISLAPVGIVLFSIGFYLLNAESYVKNIWTASIFFMFFQVLTFTFLSRWGLVHRTKFFLFHAVSVLLSFYIYQALIIKGLPHLLPDETNLRTDLWLLIAGFFYSIFYQIPENERNFLLRKKNYAKSRAEYFRNKYVAYLNNCDPILQDIILALMVYEDFNRPWVVRLIENIRKSKTRGIMQVSGATSDRSSIEMAIRAITPDYKKVMSYPEGSSERNNALYALFKNYNPGDVRYSYEVMPIMESFRDVSIKKGGLTFKKYRPLGE